VYWLYAENIVKQIIKSAVAAISLAPIRFFQILANLLGIQYFFQGDVFDRLLECRTTARLKNGETLTFHTPNNLTRFRALTLLSKEPETLDWIDGFEKNSIFWDVGANVGIYSLYAAKVSACKVYAFEPSIENTYLLNRNIAENDLQGSIFAFPFPLSESSGPNVFQHSKIQLGGAINSFGVDYSYDGKPAKFIYKYQVFGFRADDLADMFGIPAPNYLKIDVDGIEHLIARGASRVLSNQALRSVLIELNLKFPEQRNEILSIFESSGLFLQKYEHASGLDGDGAFSGIYNHIFTRDHPPAAQN
jgi:FkbM family methyltransferase